LKVPNRLPGLGGGDMSQEGASAEKRELRSVDWFWLHILLSRVCFLMVRRYILISEFRVKKGPQK